MKRFFLSFLALFFPWAIFMLENRLELALLGIILQATVIGWIPMSFVAWKHREALMPSKQPKPPEQAG